MIVYFNIYGNNLDKIKGEDLVLDHIHFYSKGKVYDLDLAGEGYVNYDSCIEGNIKCDEVDMDGTVYSKDELEEALMEAIDIKLYAYLDPEEDERMATQEDVQELNSITIDNYDVQIIIGDVDRSVHGSFDCSVNSDEQ